MFEMTLAILFQIFPLIFMSLFSRAYTILGVVIPVMLFLHLFAYSKLAIHLCCLCEKSLNARYSGCKQRHGWRRHRMLSTVSKVFLFHRYGQRIWTTDMDNRYGQRAQKYGMLHLLVWSFKWLTIYNSAMNCTFHKSS